MVSITTLTSTFSAALAALKEIAKVAQKTKDRELNQSVLELQQLLMSENTQLLELAGENQKLGQQISWLEKKADIEKHLAPDREVYWWDRDGRKDGPYCKVCWHSKEQLIQLRAMAETGLYQCVKCEGMFKSLDHISSTFLPPDRRVRLTRNSG